MFEKMNRWIRINYARMLVNYLSKKSSQKTISLSECWKDINKCLICIPSDGVTEQAVGVVVKRIQYKFPEAKLLFAKTSDSVQQKETASDLFLISPEKFYFFGAPKNYLKQYFRTAGVDLAVDLSQKYEPIFAYCCLISGAKMKVGFNTAENNSVFNFQISPKPERKGIERFEVLASYLG